MHRLIRENLEVVLRNDEVLKGASAEHPASRHLAECQECREDVAAMRRHTALLQGWRAPAQEEVEPRAGFYARVMDRIEAQGPASIWNLFFDSIFGRRLALASLTLAVLLGLYLVSTEPVQPELAFADDAVEVLPVPMPAGQFVSMHDTAGVMPIGDPDEDSVLVNLVTYREQ